MLPKYFETFYYFKISAVCWLSVEGPTKTMKNTGFLGELSTKFLVQNFVVNGDLQAQSEPAQRPAKVTRFSIFINADCIGVLHVVNAFSELFKKLGLYHNTFLWPQWKGSNRKQSAWWQHVSQLKASAFCIW